MIFYLVRHGQTDWNNERRFQGQTDIPMNEAGIRQIGELADGLVRRGIRFDRLIASPLIRAKRTAEIIAERTGFPDDIVFDADFMERSCGALEGQLWTPELDYTDPAYGMETDRELLKRAGRALRKYAFTKDERVMIVSHGAMLYAVRTVLSDHKLGLDDRTAPVIQGNVLCCVKEEGRDAVFFNLF
ncbi:MAG: histidine phosphatase family protein [Clostridia bacterium]|nr:histidine phosphatase family protein [Clostridia bacterium]